MRIVIAEDQVLLRDGLVRLLEGAGHQVLAQVGDARSLVAAVNADRPDLLIADIRMPPDLTDDGARAALFLRSRFPRLAVLMLTQVVDPQIATRVLASAPLAEAAPAFGYLVKDRVLDTESFLERIETVAAGGTAIDPHIIDEVQAAAERDGAKPGGAVAVGSTAGAGAPGAAVRTALASLTDLTERESAVMRLVASGRSNAGIAAALVISVRTVDAHLRSIFLKLDVDAGPDDNPRVLAIRAWLAATSASWAAG